MANFLRKILDNKHRMQPEYAAKVRRDIDSLPELSAKLELLMHNRQFRVDQKKPEFLALLEKIRKKNAGKILEIGGRRGGSSILFSLAAGDQAHVLTIDLNNRGSRLKSLDEFNKGRNIEFWQGDSHLEETVRRVENYLKGDRFDVLFIDGDHTYEGAKQDFINYCRFLKEDGFIALHDIQQDYGARYNVDTASWTGGVPKFWNEIKAAGFRTEDLISDPFQDGYGIGIVYWEKAVSESLLDNLPGRST